MVEVHAELSDVVILDHVGTGRYAVGRIYNDKKGRWKDGTPIHTSLIQKWIADEEGRMDRIFQTLNSTYRVRSYGSEEELLIVTF